jgi:hypothetical protein
VIVGGGIGGLTAAVALRATGALGLAEPVGRIAARISGFRLCRPHRTLLLSQTYGPDAPQLGVHRADLAAVLVAALSAGVVHTGHRCTQFTQHDGSATMPTSGLSMPARHLPDPDGPDTTTNSPAETEMETPCSASVCASPGRKKRYSEVASTAAPPSRGVGANVVVTATKQTNR